MVTTLGNKAEFRFYRPDAAQVFLVGDFVGWQTGRCPMKLTGKGEWVVQVVLPPGEYKFRYLADGQWFTDYAAFGVEYGPLGFDSLVRIVQAEPAAARAPAGKNGPLQRVA